MTAAMAEARAAAKAPMDGVRDWYDGVTFREAIAAGLFDTASCMALGISMDGFEVWRQRGCQGCPFVATVLSVHPGERVKNVAQIIPAVTPGPRQPVDVESFLHPVAKELDEMAKVIDGIKVAGRDGTSTLHVHVLQFTADMPGGDKLLNAKVHNGQCPGRFREFCGVRVK